MKKTAFFAYFMLVNLWDKRLKRVKNGFLGINIKGQSVPDGL
jgi:hypothetical protein